MWKHAAILLGKKRKRRLQISNASGNARPARFGAYARWQFKRLGAQTSASYCDPLFLRRHWIQTHPWPSPNGGRVTAFEERTRSALLSGFCSLGLTFQE